VQVIDTLPSGKKHFVAVVGSPGSGKSTLTNTVCKLVNIKRPGSCTIIPMDGFHYYKRELDQMKDPVEAYRRRGAPFTFNAAAFFKLLQKIKIEGKGAAPSFDHKVGDPVENDIPILEQNKVILVEGNYVLLDHPDWRPISALMDEKWFIDCDIDVAMNRVRLRHIGTGLTNEKAIERVEGNDRPNGLLVQQCRSFATKIVKSIDVPGFY